jgi:L-threonine kinase
LELEDGPNWDVPTVSPKASAAVRVGLSHLDCDRGGRLRVASDIPRGRGYGSSTADIGGVLYGLASLLGVELSPAEVATLATRIEPSDSTLFPGLALISHRNGHRLEGLGRTPRLDVLVLDPGGYVDTIRFNATDHASALHRLRSDHAEAFAILAMALARGDHSGIGHAATMSATAHQAILPNPLCPAVCALARETRALGVCRAHSGTLWGVLLDPARSDVPGIESYTLRRLPPGVSVRREALVGGGPRYRPA